MKWDLGLEDYHWMSFHSEAYKISFYSQSHYHTFPFFSLCIPEERTGYFIGEERAQGNNMDEESRGSPLRSNRCMKGNEKTARILTNSEIKQT